MAHGVGLPPFPPPNGHHLGHPGVNGGPHMVAAAAHSLTGTPTSSAGRPTSTPSTGTSAFNGKFSANQNRVG